jgi:hypothetical protein
VAKVMVMVLPQPPDDLSWDLNEQRLSVLSVGEC